MSTRALTVPEIAFIAGTRGMLGAGIGLLLSARLTSAQRQAVGWTLVVAGAVTTIPAAFAVFGRSMQDQRRVVHAIAE